MSKILVLANHYNTLRIFRRELLKSISGSGHEVLISIPPCDENNKTVLESYGCSVVFTKMERRGMNPVQDAALFCSYRRLIRQFRPDKIISYTVKCNIYGALAAGLCHVPIYCNITGLGSPFQKDDFKKKIVSFLYRHSMRYAEKIFTENSGDGRTLAVEGIAPADKIVIMQGAGVNLEEFRLKSYPSEDSGIRFLFVGRIMQEKGVDELFEVIRMIKTEYPDTQFDFIGWYEDNYRETVEQLEKDGLIHFYGFQEDVRPFIENAHCLILPSWHEGMSNTLLEGAAVGRPLITYAIHGCMEAVNDGLNGFLAEKKNKESLRNAIIKFLSLTSEERREMGVCGRKKMEAEFDKKNVVNRTLQEMQL